MKTIERKCFNCGENFLSTIHFRKYCSKECKEQFHNIRELKPIDKGLEKKHKLECEYCSKTFYSNTKTSGFRHCSKECMTNYFRMKYAHQRRG